MPGTISTARVVAHIEVTDPDGRRRIALDRPRQTIGQTAESDVCLVNPDVSKDHAEIVIEAPGVIAIRDRGSKYGTFVNDEQITARPLRHAGTAPARDDLTIVALTYKG